MFIVYFIVMLGLLSRPMTVREENLSIYSLVPCPRATVPTFGVGFKAMEVSFIFRRRRGLEPLDCA